MKKTSSSVVSAKALLLLLVLALSPVLRGGELELVNGNKTSYVIAFAESPSPNLATQYRNAAELLKALIAKRTGVAMPVVPEKTLKPGTPAIYVGPGTAATAPATASDFRSARSAGWA